LSSNQKTNTKEVLLFLLALFLPTQLGKHFWPDFSLLLGLRIDYLSPTIYFTDILVLFLFIFWILRKHTSHISKNGWLYLGAFSFLSLTIISNKNFLHGIYQLIKFLEFSFLAYYLSTTIKQINQMRNLAIAFSLGVVGESVIALFQFLHQSSLGGVLYYLGERNFNAQTPGIANASLNGVLTLRPYGTFSHPNVLAGYLLISMTFILFIFLNTNSSLKKFLYGLAVLLGTAGLLLSLSRVSIVLWGVTLVSIGILRFRRSLNKKKIVILAGAVGLFIVSGIVSSPIGNRFSQINLSDEAVVQRELLGQKAFAMIISRPIFGVGFGDFLPALSTDKNLASQGFLQPVHNIFLLIAAETGLIGLVFFIFFLTKTYRALLQKIKLDKNTRWFYYCWVLCLTLILVIGQFDHYFLTLQQGQLLFAYVIGLCWVKKLTKTFG
jgi:O-antigen ligase